MNTTPVEAPRNPSFRWFQFLAVPTLINVSSLVLFPMFLTDALTFPLLVICGVPILWSGYMLFGFRSWPERVIAYIATVMAVVWAAAMLDLLTSYGYVHVSRSFDATFVSLNEPC